MIIRSAAPSALPESPDSEAKWLSDDTRHMLAELTPVPDQVTVTVNTTQMNVTEHAGEDDFRGVSRGFRICTRPTRT